MTAPAHLSDRPEAIILVPGYSGPVASLPATPDHTAPPSRDASTAALRLLEQTP
jgi:hypothetical protein